MENNSHNSVATLKSISVTIHTLVENLLEYSQNKRHAPTLCDDLLWAIFMGSDPRVAARCRSLSKHWEHVLLSDKFILENFKANRERKQSVIVGIGYPPTNQKSHWFVRIDAKSGEQIPLNIPANINIFGYYSMIGSDHGNLCIRVTESGINSRLLIWNPLTDESTWVADKGWKKRNYAVALNAFSYMVDSTDYRIIRVWKGQVEQRQLSWCVYKSEQEAWCENDGSIFWIGWGGQDFTEPKVILYFSLGEMELYEGKIPTNAVSENNALLQINNRASFITHREVGFSREVVVWQLHREGHDTLVWERMFKVRGFAFPFTPTILVGSSIISILECKNSFSPANNIERTDLYISKGKNKNKEMDFIYHNHWEEDIHVKILTLHSEGLYPV
ncbi:hypothetical protein PIB30_088670 [Stylosanthes scabra]|uniref:F-box domain-containing protein n=1 Tax=Stylosanthes scabra TaxID=79078 RepID=A0ABU6TV61_9FABA|nr:hypothetical protein [Stylosanthes scabra]